MFHQSAKCLKCETKRTELKIKITTPLCSRDRLSDNRLLIKTRNKYAWQDELMLALREESIASGLRLVQASTSFGKTKSMFDLM